MERGKHATNLTPAKPLPSWPDGDFGLILSVRSSCGDGLLKIGKILNNKDCDIRAVDFTGCLSNSKCTRVKFQRSSDKSHTDSVVMNVQMMDPLADVSPAGDISSDYTYTLVVADGGLVAVKDLSNEKLDGIRPNEDFWFKQYNYESTDDSVTMSVHDEKRTYIASDKTGHVIMMKSQENFNNPFSEMRIIDEGKLKTNKNDESLISIRHQS